MKTDYIDYQDGDVALEGYFAWDETLSEQQPVVLIAHDWSGRREPACSAAESMVDLGYAGFAVDIYGKGVFGKDGDTAGNSALMQPYVEDRALLRQRMLAALTAVRELGRVDPSKIGVVGYCFGGMAALELARSGADIDGVVSVHGLLNQSAIHNEKIVAKVLCLHGHDDPMGLPDQVLAFQTEMSLHKADWQMHIFGGVKHAFTNPDANNQSIGTVYNSSADQRSKRLIADFLLEIFA
jgi:dienelactone hydrolase